MSPDYGWPSICKNIGHQHKNAICRLTYDCTSLRIIFFLFREVFATDPVHCTSLCIPRSSAGDPSMTPIEFTLPLGPIGFVQGKFVAQCCAHKFTKGSDSCCLHTALSFDHCANVTCFIIKGLKSRNMLEVKNVECGKDLNFCATPRFRHMVVSLKYSLFGTIGVAL
jgi:hypothetical protein